MIVFLVSKSESDDSFSRRLRYFENADELESRPDDDEEKKTHSVTLIERQEHPARK